MITTVNAYVTNDTSLFKENVNYFYSFHLRG